VTARLSYAQRKALDIAAKNEQPDADEAALLEWQRLQTRAPTWRCLRSMGLVRFGIVSRLWYLTDAGRAALVTR
jgi:hypothetical protein